MRTIQLARAAFGFALSAVLLGALASCATAPKIDWNSRIGNYTYDQAVLELGPPEKDAKLTDGTRVADWLMVRGRTYVAFDSGPPFYRYPYYSHYGMHQSTLTSWPDQYLRLTFSPDGKLQAWRRVAK